MVRFCSKCGTYISPHQEACSRCAPVEAKTPLVTLPPSELTIETVLNSFPSDTMRPYQKEILNNVVEAFQSGKKCVLVIAPTGFGKCLTQCERIFSEKGLIRIKDVQQSDDHNFRTHVFHLGRAKTVRIRTRHGYSLHGGHDHRIITFDGEFGWRKLSSLKTGDCVPIFAKKSLGVDVAVNDLPARYNKTGAPPAAILLPRSLTTQLAELLGLYLSEGSIGRSVVHISTDDESIKADIAKVARQCKISFSVADREIRLNSIHMVRLLVDMVGVGSHNKKVPEQIFRAKQNIRAAFLRGCFRGDGDVNISRNVSEYFTVSRELAQGIQLLLLSVGVFSTLARKSGQYRDRAHKSWRVTLTGSQNVRFLRLVFGERVAADSSSSWETIPMIEHKLNTVFRTFLKVKGIRHRSKEYTALKTVESYVLGYRKPTRKTLKRYLQSMSEVSYLKQYAELMRLTEVDCLFDYVEGVVNSREEDLYDLSCADGTYVSNGFVSHNSYVNAAFSSVTKSFYVTPQLALIDQLLADPHLKNRFVEIKGRQNYRCYYSPHRGVHVGKCETEDYPCHERFDVCPYWMQKQLALQAPSVLMSLAYLTFEGTTEGSETYLGTRSLLVLDEAHNLEEQCLSHVALQFTPFSVPYEIYHKFLPNLRNVDGRVEMEAFLANVAEYLKLLLGRLETKAETHGLAINETENKKAMERFLENHHLFTFSRSEWVWQIRNDQLLLQPVFAREFMKDLVWKRGEHYLISSATILDPQEYIKLNGLTDFLKEDEIAILQVPSIFPAENRPIIDATVGVLSKQQWEHNMPLAVATVEQILRKEPGNVAIHCHSYRHQRALVANLSPDLKHRLIVHTGKDREEKLREWMRSRGKVFVSVAFNEGQDWKYDICLVPDEEIMTSEGVKKISDVRTGDRVLTHKGRFRKVKDVKTRNYNGKVISIAPYYTAQPFRVTTQHPILTDKGWVNAEQIVDERIAYPRLPSSSKSVPRIDLTYEVRRRGFHKCENSSHTAHYFRENIQLHRELSPSEMRLCGYYLAEGSTGQHQVILYFGKTARELEYARDAARLFRELFNRKASIRHTEYGNAVVFGSINAAKWFSSMFGQRAIEKKIPTSWLYSDDKHIVELLRGYFRGDGNHYENVFRAITASITLAHEIRLLLARFGIVATVSMRKGGMRTIQGRMANTHTRYPISISRTQAVQAFQLLGEKLTVRRKRSFKVKATICNDYIYSQIHNKSTSHYSGKVYNLEVEEDNSYVGVSCIYHNCDAQILLKVPFADIGDMRVKRRLELGQRQWYENQAMLEAIQAYGRAIRAEDDMARFYVVDGSFISLVRNTWQFIPDWFKAALPPTFTI